MDKTELLQWLEKEGFKLYDDNSGIVRLWKGDICVSIFEDGRARAVSDVYQLPSLTVLYCNKDEYEQIERWVNRTMYYRSQLLEEKSEDKK